ncbi:MAG TPA: hypothetical protein VK395_27165 [Gemmataceae bacterium]|nr:hypothetical protein [Gemmataceae bacterium]
MKPLRGIVCGCALALLGASGAPVNAAWCNVFQVCWHRSAPATSSYYYAPPPCTSCNPCPCPQPACQTCYVQRSYYQPVTVYQTKSYYEPVTTYQTSYYYEPVNTIRYSSYYDPCSCSYQQIACPTTSYQLRSQCTPVQSYVQRSCQVPVTAYQQAFYWDPVTSCSAPACPTCPQVTAAYVPAPSGCCGTPALFGVPTAPPPVVTEQQRPTTPGVTETPNRSGTRGNGYIPPQEMPPASGSSYRQATPNGVAPTRQTGPVATPPEVRFDRIASAAVEDVSGQVVLGKTLPVPGAQVLFVGSDRQTRQQAVTADAAGKFRVTLASGSWLVYIQGADGRPVFDRKLDVGSFEVQPVSLVSRR